jgi:hypothetical protein
VIPVDNYAYTTHALVIKKEVGDLKITITAELPTHISTEEALDTVLDVILDISDKLPVDHR